MDIVALITGTALIVAVVAFARVVLLVARFGDDRATSLSRAFVLHGVACLVLAGADLIVDPLGLAFPLQVLAGLMTAAWGATWVIVGRAYGSEMSIEERPPEQTRRFERELMDYLAERERS